MSEKKRGFVAYVSKSGKITIPYMIRKLLGLRPGDMVDISEIRIVEQKKETA